MPKNDDEMFFKKCLADFYKLDNNSLIENFNAQVDTGFTGVGKQLLYIKALTQTLKERFGDKSVSGNDTLTFSLGNKLQLKGNSIEILKK